MTRAPAPTLARLVVLVLLSAAGLVGIGVIGMWRALENAEAGARAEARQTAFATVRGIRDALRRPEALALLPERWHFDVDAQGLVVPERLRAWGEVAEVSFGIESLLRRVEQIEFALRDPTEASRVLEEALASELVDRHERTALGIARAWLAERTGETDRRDDLLAELISSSDPPASDFAPSLLVLCATAGKPLPSWAAAALAAMEPAPAGAVLARMRELSAPPRELATLEQVTADSADLRETLDRVRARVPALQEAEQLRVESRDGRTLVYQPQGRERGSGVLAPNEELARRLRAATLEAGGALPVIGWSGNLVFGAARSAESMSVFPGVWIEPSTPAATELPRWLVVAILGALALLLALGLSLILRTLRRERAALALRSEFLSSVTHELKTPLSSIRMFAEMLEEQRVPAGKQPEYLRMLAAESGRLSALVENVLDLGRTERGERSYDLQEVALDEVVREALALFAPVAEREDITVQYTAQPVRVRADRNALRQVLLNVFDNAGKYAAAGKRLDISVTGGTDASVRMQDHGPGIDAAERERVFERFRRGAAQQHGSVPGVGLGLYLARAIVRAHGGELRCVEPHGNTSGACFLLTLPIVDGERA